MVSKSLCDPFPRLIHQTWKNKELPDLFSYWASSWKGLNPDYEYRLWTDDDNLNFIKEMYPEFLDDYLSYNHHIKKVDAARYFYLYTYGGIYCDLDFECLKPFDKLLEDLQSKDIILGSMGSDIKFQHSIPNAIMISKPKAPFWLYVISEMRKRINKGEPEYDTGPKLLHYCLNTYKEQHEIAILKPEMFYGINWASEKGQNMRRRIFEEKSLLSEDEKSTLFPNAFAVTYWAHSW